MPSVSHHNIHIVLHTLAGPEAFVTWFADAHSPSWKRSDDRDVYDGTFSSREEVDFCVWLDRLGGSLLGMWRSDFYFEKQICQDFFHRMIDSVENLLSYESPFYWVFAIGQDKQDTAVCFLSAIDVDTSSHNCDTDSYSKRKIVIFLFPRKTDKWSASCF